MINVKLSKKKINSNSICNKIGNQLTKTIRYFALLVLSLLLIVIGGHILMTFLFVLALRMFRKREEDQDVENFDELGKSYGTIDKNLKQVDEGEYVDIDEKNDGQYEQINLDHFSKNNDKSEYLEID